MNLASIAANLDAFGKAASEYAASAPSLDLNALVSSQPRGLYNFISEIRNAKSKEEERARVDKELANIRVKFANSANLTSRDKKKYVWKMCYMYMLGYDIDFGHLEFISLLSSSKFQEKSVGYMAFSLMMRPGDELMTLVVNSMRNDLIGQLIHGQTLALAAVSNIGGNDLAEALAGDVQRLILGTMETRHHNVAISAEEEVRNRSLVCKKAALCLLRLYRTNPDCLQPDEWLKRLARLLEDRDLGVVTSVMSLLLGLASANPSFFEPLVPYVISILNRLVVTRSCSADYLYYRTPSPWLQVKCLRLLQYYRPPAERTQAELLNEVLGSILIKTEVSESQNKSNADHSILFEAVNLVILYGPEAAAYLKDQVCTLLGRFIAVKDPNIRYLGLDAMTRLAKQDGPEAVQMHQSTVLESLKDTDISVRKRALNLIFVLTDRNNAQGIVADLLGHLAEADSAMKEDIVVKTAILAEKFSTDLHWYVNTMVQVILVAGDYVAEAVWYRVVQIVINNPSIHEYAAQKMLLTVEGKYAHDNVVAIAAYLLGEIGVNICEHAGMSGFDQFNALQQHMGNCSAKVQAILLTTYMKLLNLYPEQVADQVREVFTRYSTSCHLELQQRACEYLALPGIAADTMEAVLNPMPPFEMEGKESALSALLALSVGSSHTSGVSADKVAAGGASQGTIERESEVSPKKEIASVQKPQAKPAAAAVTDLLSMDEEPSPTAQGGASSSSAGGIGLSSEVVATLPALLRAAALVRGPTAKALLLRNELLKVSVSADYRAHQARLALYFDNESNFDILNLKVAVSCVASSQGALNVKQQDPAAQVSPGDEARMQLALECLRPFADTFPLELEVRFTVGGSAYAYTLPVPVAAVCFFEPLPSDKNTYMGRWKALDGGEGEAQLVFSSARPVDAALMQHIRTVLVPAMKVGLAEGLDNERTVTGTSTFLTGTAGADGKPVSVGVMMRLEADFAQSKFRITARAKHAAVAQAVKNFIVDQLSA